MAGLYKKVSGDATFACYSERGVVSYFMFRVLPKDPSAFLRKIADGAGASPFAAVRNYQLAKLTIFSELSFGSKYGFGNPDGALYFEMAGKPLLIFYEAKINETYMKSCKGLSYNSTIQGQLELKWRLVTLFQMGSVERYKGAYYIKETDEFAAFYSNKDELYSARSEEEDLSLASCRHLALKDGVKRIFEEYVKKCEAGRIYFLASTSDTANPLLDEDSPRPRCCGRNWDEVKSHFLWINNFVIENSHEA